MEIAWNTEYPITVQALTCTLRIKESTSGCLCSVLGTGTCFRLRYLALARKMLQNRTRLNSIHSSREFHVLLYLTFLGTVAMAMDLPLICVHCSTSYLAVSSFISIIRWHSTPWSGPFHQTALQLWAMGDVLVACWANAHSSQGNHFPSTSYHMASLTLLSFVCF